MPWWTRHCVGAGFLALTLTGSLAGQGTRGKIQGTVLDPTGQPLVHAQVIVLGTSLSALTNDDGYYFINNVPAGTYDIRAQFIGYQSHRMEGVRILADQTLEATFQLGGAVALEAVVVTAAVAPLVPRDQVASKSIVTGEELTELPIDDPLEAVLLQPGVTEIRGGEISIRGSRAEEVTIFVDGVPVRPMDLPTGVQFQTSTNTLAEASVVTGAMEAAFGDAQAGIVSLVTRAGGPQFAGTFAYETDEILGADLSNGWNRFEGALSGPIIGNLTFSAGGTVNGKRAFWINKNAEEFADYTWAGIDTMVTVPVGTTDSAALIIPQFVQFSGKCDADENRDAYGNPVPCQGKIVPNRWQTDLRLNGKLQYTFGQGSRISLSLMRSVSQNQNGHNRNLAGSWGNRYRSDVLVLNWVQQVFRGRDNELALDASVSYQTDDWVGGWLDREQDLRLRDPALGIVLEPLRFNQPPERWGWMDPALHMSRGEDGGWILSRLVTDEDWDALIENIRYNRGTRSAYDAEQFRSGRVWDSWTDNVAGGRVNPWGLLSAGGYSDGTGIGSNFRVERRWVGRFNVQWQSDRYNRFTFGGDGTMSRSAIEEGNRRYVGEPYKFGLFAQDRIDLGDVVIEVGGRFDQFAARANMPSIPQRISSHPAFDPTLSVEEMTCPDAPERCDPLQWVWVRSRVHNTVSPRVRVSFPITERTGFRFSYAHQTQAPFFEHIYANNNADLNAQVSGGWNGGDLDFSRTILFEFGLRHAFKDWLVLDVAGYNKDKVSDVAARTQFVYDPVFQRNVEHVVMTNADFGSVRGVEFQLLGRVGRVFSGQVSYTYQNAKNTGSDPFDFINNLAIELAGQSLLDRERVEPPQNVFRTADDRRHAIQGTLSVNLAPDLFGRGFVRTLAGDLGIFGTFQYRSGLPYTRSFNLGDGNVSGGVPRWAIEPAQTSETPWERFFDLRVTKGLRLGPTTWTLYVDARNLFNFTNTPTVFAETGNTVNDLHRERFVANELDVLEFDATRSELWIEIQKPCTEPGCTGTRTIGAIDLTDLSTACAQWAGGDGAIGCIMLQRAEARFGNGDGFYDEDEQRAVVNAFYAYGYDPTWFLGPGRTIRVGLELRF